MMTPNNEQIQSMIRWVMSIFGTYLIARGITEQTLTTLVSSILIIAGAIPPIISFIWGLMAHTDKAKIEAVEKLPDVKSIVAVANPNPKSAVAAAVADTTLPKVRAAT